MFLVCYLLCAMLQDECNIQSDFEDRIDGITEMDEEMQPVAKSYKLFLPEVFVDLITEEVPQPQAKQKREKEITQDVHETVKAEVCPMEEPKELEIGQHVKFFNKYGKKYFGVVRWKKEGYVGIQTVSTRFCFVCFACARIATLPLECFQNQPS